MDIHGGASGHERPAHTEKDKVTFSAAPRNVLQIDVSSPQFEGRNFIGFDSKSNQYWRTEMGVFGGILRETFTDGVNFCGNSNAPRPQLLTLNSATRAVQPFLR